MSLPAFIFYFLPAAITLIGLVITELYLKRTEYCYQFTFGKLFLFFTFIVIPCVNIIAAVTLLFMGWEQLEMGKRIDTFMNKPVIPTIKSIFIRKKKEV